MTKPKKMPAKKLKTSSKCYHSQNLQKITTLCAAFHLPVLEPGAVEQAAPPKLPPEMKQSTTSFFKLRQQLINQLFFDLLTLSFILRDFDDLLLGLV